MQSKLNPAGAVYAFICWLTVREEETVLSRTANAAPAMELAKKFNEVQGLEYQGDWPEVMVPMEGQDLKLRRPLDTLTTEEAHQVLTSYYSNNPRVAGILVESVFGGAIRYSVRYHGSAAWSKQAIRIENLGFKAFNHLLSLGFNLK